MTSALNTMLESRVGTANMMFSSIETWSGSESLMRWKDESDDCCSKQ